MVISWGYSDKQGGNCHKLGGHGLILGHSDKQGCDIHILGHSDKQRGKGHILGHSDKQGCPVLCAHNAPTPLIHACYAVYQNKKRTKQFKNTHNFGN